MFTGSGGTISAVIKMFNDYGLDKETFEFLLNEFYKINPQASPLKVGVRIEIPVLLQYCERHEKPKRLPKMVSDILNGS